MANNILLIGYALPLTPHRYVKYFYNVFEYFLLFLLTFQMISVTLWYNEKRYKQGGIEYVKSATHSPGIRKFWLDQERIYCHDWICSGHSEQTYPGTPTNLSFPCGTFVYLRLLIMFLSICCLFMSILYYETCGMSSMANGYLECTVTGFGKCLSDTEIGKRKVYAI